jgi:hypothetical protein
MDGVDSFVIVYADTVRPIRALTGCGHVIMDLLAHALLCAVLHDTAVAVLEIKNCAIDQPLKLSI